MKLWVATGTARHPWPVLSHRSFHAHRGPARLPARASTIRLPGTSTLSFGHIWVDPAGWPAFPWSGSESNRPPGIQYPTQPLSYRPIASSQVIGLGFGL